MVARVQVCPAIPTFLKSGQEYFVFSVKINGSRPVFLKLEMRLDLNRVKMYMN